MAEEATTENRVLTLLGRMEERQEAGFDRLTTRMESLREEVQAFRLETHGRLSHLEGGFEQMDKRMGDLSARMASTESLQRWAIGLIITSWLTLVGLAITVLLKMP